MLAKYRPENLKKKQLLDKDIEESIVLKRTLEKCYEKMWTEFSWFRIQCQIFVKMVIEYSGSINARNILKM
jgi:hypothetical protein